MLVITAAKKIIANAADIFQCDRVTLAVNDDAVARNLSKTLAFSGIIVMALVLLKPPFGIIVATKNVIIAMGQHPM